MLFKELDSIVGVISLEAGPPGAYNELVQALLNFQVFLIRRCGNQLHNLSFGEMEVSQDVMKKFEKLREAYRRWEYHTYGDLKDSC